MTKKISKKHSRDLHGQDVCSKRITVVLEDDVVQEVQIVGGCPGNSKAVAALVRGRPASEVIELLGGMQCGPKKTSCADQLAQTLREAIANQPTN